MPTGVYPRPIESRFWAKVDRRGPDECWPWLGSCNSVGYGRISLDRKWRFATHYALSLTGKPRPGKAGALHSCDNPPCCNPAHLRWGTQKENVADARKRGRHTSATGRSGPKSRKLSDDQRAEIKKSSRFCRELAAQYGVSVSTILRARNI